MSSDADRRLGVVAVAAFASLGAGAVHAAAVGVHSEHRQAVWAFAGVGLAQLAAGVVALVSRSRRAVALIALVNAVALGGWALAKTSGIGFVEGMTEAEAVQLADGLAAAMAAVAVVAGVVVLVRPAVEGRVATAGPGIVAALGAIALTAASVGMVSAGSHAHAGGGDHGGAEHAEGEHAEGEHAEGEHAAPVVPPEPYDPELPIDLSGVDGVSPQQQARAENLIAITLDRLPQFADHRHAEAMGYHSIGDGLTGHEHYIKWDLINDDVFLNPDQPESLVYEIDRRTGDKTLVSAMFMVNEGTDLADVPDVGGTLTQWHVHDDLCFSNDPVAPRVVGVTTVGGDCRPPATKLGRAPMLHVWITPHPCGPFAALEGVGAGQVAEGEEHFCNHAHGA
jgi:hypothetical protein